MCVCVLVFIHLFFENHWIIILFHIIVCYQNNIIMDRFETERKIPYCYYNMLIVLFTGRVFHSSVQFPRIARKSGEMATTRFQQQQQQQQQSLDLYTEVLRLLRNFRRHSPQ